MPAAVEVSTVNSHPDINEIWLHPNSALIVDPVSAATQMNLARVIPNPNAVTFLGSQKGDEAKGRWTYECAHLRHLRGEGGVALRPGGGPGAGHTLHPHEGLKIIFRMLPSALDSDWMQIAGRGELVQPDIVIKELQLLEEHGFDTSPQRIMIDGAAFLAWDAYVALDEAEEERRGAGAVGTTKSGVGPAAMDYTGRHGFRIGELLLPSEILGEKVTSEVARVNGQLKALGSSREFNPEEVYLQFESWAERLRDHIQNTYPIITSAIRTGNFVAEGAQAFGISLDTGFRGAVTSTDSGPGSLERRYRISRDRLGHRLGVVKLVPTAVGRHIIHSPLPEDLQELLYTRTAERGDPEAGAVSGRKRQYYWLSVPEIRAAAETYGLTGLVVSKVDALDTVPEIHFGLEYVFIDGITTTDYDPDDPKMLNSDTRMNTLKLDGWQESTAGMTDYNDAPHNLKAVIETLSHLTGLPVHAVGTGPYFGEAIYAEGSPFVL